MNESLEYLWSLERLGLKPGLERIEALLAALGHPEREFASVHVAGTNGKGSVCCMIERVLREEGYVTGLYTSPHLIDFRERIQIGGVMISEAELAELIDEVRMVNEGGSIGVTFFEFVTAVAFLYFARQKVEIAVVEVGMGGLLDATNVVIPEVAVVTNVGLDHTEFLGETKEKIAGEKGGVFKAGAAAITGERDERVLAVLEERAEEAGVQLVRAYEEVPVCVVEHDLEGQVIEVIKDGDTKQLAMRLVGQHQAENAAVALAALEALRKRGWKVSEDSLKRGIEAAWWPGRLQVLQTQPLMVADAAHNEDGLVALGNFLEDMPLGPSATLLVGLKKGRDVGPLVEQVAKYFEYVVVSRADYLAEEPEVVAEALQERGVKNIEVWPERAEAIRRARELAGEEGMVLVTGSIYLVGDIMKEISKSK